jgi:hypothetical protein
MAKPYRKATQNFSLRNSGMVRYRKTYGKAAITVVEKA